jgi:hypothetical protein
MLKLSNKPVIALYTSSADSDAAPKFKDEYYFAIYSELFRRLIKLGARPIVVFDAEKTYQGTGKFIEYWEPSFTDDGVTYNKVNEAVIVDLLYDKSRFPYEDIIKINPSNVSKICFDKSLTYLFAPDMHPQSYLLENDEHMKVFEMSHKGDEVAIKQLDSYGGKAVFVGNLADYKGNLEFPLLAQEFIDTSRGYKQLVGSYHDIRVALFNGEPVHGLLRQPPTGDVMSSTIDNGGSSKALYVREIPDEIVKKAKDLDDRFNIDAPRFFAADFGFDGKEWKLIEMNSAPSLAHESVDGLAANEYLDLVANKLIESTETQ